MAKTAGLLGGAAPKAAPAVPKGLPGLGGLLGGGAGAGQCGFDRQALGAGHLGGATGPAVSHAAAVPVTVSAAPEASAGPGNLLGGMPLGGAGSGIAGGAGPLYGFKPTVMAWPPPGRLAGPAGIPFSEIGEAFIRARIFCPAPGFRCLT